MGQFVHILAFALVAMVLPVGAADAAEETLPQRQRGITERMERVEQRLLDLVARAESPGKAEALRRALSQSRESFLVSRMGQAAALLEEGDYQGAADLEQRALDDLRRLAATLAGEDPQQLSRLRRAAERLDEIITRQTEAEDMAARADTPAIARELAQTQATIQCDARALSADLAGGAGAAELSSAAQQMGAAADALRAADGAAALAAQANAAAWLKEARNALRRRMQQVLQTNRARARAALRRTLQAALEEQKAIRDTTATVNPPRQGEEPSRVTRLRLAALAQRQRHLEDRFEEALKSASDAAAAHAWPAALRQLSADARACALLLQDGRAARALRSQDEIILMLEDLVEALRPESPEGAARLEEQSSPGRQPQEPQVNLAEELLVMRALQMGINRRTQRLQDGPADGLEALADRQTELKQNIQSLAESAAAAPAGMLRDIGHRMAEAEGLLRGGQVNARLQSAQRQIVERLDILIELARAAGAATQKKSRPGEGSKRRAGQRPAGAPLSHMEESRLASGPAPSAGSPGSAPAAGDWAPGLPESERRKISDSFRTGRLPARYMELLRSYNKRLAREAK